MLYEKQSPVGRLPPEIAVLICKPPPREIVFRDADGIDGKRNMTKKSRQDRTQGSLWHRWDPHLHAPGTVLNDQFHGDWNAYLAKINSASPSIRALGVTDYLCIHGYQAVLKRWHAGHLPGVEFLFPNVELRLDIKTDRRKPINLHLLFSPDDPDHETQIERLLSRLRFKGSERDYACTRSELIALGREHDPNQTDDEAAFRTGVNQFKVTFEQLLDLWKGETWLRQNCLIAVAGSNNDGTAGLAADHSFAMQRRTIERFAHIIFASTPSQRAFWLGKSPAANAQKIEDTYGFLKPCLHGSDGHSEQTTASPANDRYCWIRGDLSFDTLRQVVLEPERRIWIGDAPPQDGGGSDTIVEIDVHRLPWIEPSTLPLNPGFTAVIGSKGSGKTALIEMIAHAAGSADSQEKGSFLDRAKEHLKGSSAALTWGNDYTSPAVPLDGSNDSLDFMVPGARYLSQHFVERLCSATGLATELRAELERVVFDATEPTQRMKTSSFSDLRATLLEPVTQAREELREQLRRTTDAIVQETQAIDALLKNKEERDAQTKALEVARKDLVQLVPKGAEERAKLLARLEAAIGDVNARVELLRKQRKSITDLTQEVKRHRDLNAPATLRALQSRYPDVTLSNSDWNEFSLRFGPSVDSILAREAKSIDESTQAANLGTPATPFDRDKDPLNHWPLQELIAERDRVKKDVGLDTELLKRYNTLQQQITQKEAALRKLQTTIETAEGASDRRTALLERRRTEYRASFATLLDEEATLQTLYAPLADQIEAAGKALAKLQFVVGRHVNIKQWADEGESLLDLRKTSTFRGEGALLQIATERLAQVWATGTAEAASTAIQDFFADYRPELLKAMPANTDRANRRAWEQQLITWLYNTSHIEVHYSVQYNNTPIEKLSPGTRGIVLLLLYLVLDRADRRPLIIDQPEENLDPQSVFAELVPHFREARTRRQVIVVTHNANLVINTDADQVIVARAAPALGGLMPQLEYQSGSLENAEIRRAVCDILEGGKRAFEDRAKRYRFQL